MSLVAIGLVAAMAVPTTGATVAGSAGTNTALPKTDSQVTVGGRDAFSNLKITVNQTKNLVNQAVSITWTGAIRTIPLGGGIFGANYLQIMQCWGDDDGSVPSNPGPPPEQCEQGATNATYGGTGGNLFPPASLSNTRIVTKKGWPSFDPKVGVFDDRTGQVWMPFRSVKGEVTGVHLDPTFDPAVQGGAYWLNPNFNIVTTNEIAGARTGVNGNGAELFEVVTGHESSGLGCGLRVQPVVGGDPRTPKCWIVVVPRGSAKDEDVPTDQALPDSAGILTSPLSPSAWSHRIAIPIEFNPLDSPCTLARSQRAVAGTEVALPAIASWQPKLCAGGSRPPYVYSTISDGSARLQLQSQESGAPGVIVVSRPLDPATVSPANPVVYAPVSLSAAVLGFNVERQPKLDADAAEQSLNGVRVQNLNLTPRLLAKLLTQSYTEQVIIVQPPNYPWLKSNPPHMGLDPDFLQFNPEFVNLNVPSGKNFGGLVMPTGTSDLARQVWDYILADPEAKAWLDGAPDPWGMKVNPAYATKASANSNGIAFADPVPQSLPKADPYCYQAPPRGPSNSIIPPPLCGTDWLPYTTSLRDAAHLTRIADDASRTSEDVFAISSATVYRRDTPQVPGIRSLLSLTDSASAATYGIQAARLSRAGDDGTSRKFVAPDQPGLLAGVKAMKATTDSAVLEPDPKASAPDAYPLTTLTYAAAMPLTLDAAARDDYAAFVDYAAGPGQTLGFDIGQLPSGYAPLPASLRTQSTDAAKAIRQLVVSKQTTPTQTTPATRSTTPSTTPESGPSASSGSGYSLGARPSGATTNASTSPSAPKTSSAPSTTKIPPTTTPRIQTIATPATSMAMSRLAVPGLLVITLLSGLGVLEITKRPRRPPKGVAP